MARIASCPARCGKLRGRTVPFAIYLTSSCRGSMVAIRVPPRPIRMQPGSGLSDTGIAGAVLTIPAQVGLTLQRGRISRSVARLSAGPPPRPRFQIRGICEICGSPPLPLPSRAQRSSRPMPRRAPSGPRLPRLCLQPSQRSLRLCVRNGFCLSSPSSALSA